MSTAPAPADVALDTVRGARLSVIASLAPAATFLVLNSSTTVLGNQQGHLVLLPLALAAVGLAVFTSLAGVHGRRPAYGRLVWLTVLILVSALVLTAGLGVLPGLWLLTAAGAVVFSPRTGLAVLLASIVAFVVLALTQAFDREFAVALVVYSLVTGAAGATGPFMATRLLEVVKDLVRSRAELALTAADEERRRLSRDLHDALGQGLSAVALKGDLALALLDTDPAAARRELASLTAAAMELRRELPDIVAAGQAASYLVEAERAEWLLREAGIDVVRHGDIGPLVPAADSALGSVVREAATNVLRHSDAGRWTLAAGRDDAIVWLEATNDRPRAASDRTGSGLLGMTERLQKVGGRLDTLRQPDRFTVRAEVPT